MDGDEAQWVLDRYRICSMVRPWYRRFSRINAKKRGHKPPPEGVNQGQQHKCLVSIRLQHVRGAAMCRLGGIPVRCFKVPVHPLGCACHPWHLAWGLLASPCGGIDLFQRLSGWEESDWTKLQKNQPLTASR